jgi:hypothetical protein
VTACCVASASRSSHWSIRWPRSVVSRASCMES